MEALKMDPAPCTWEDVVAYFELRKIVDADILADKFIAYYEDLDWNNRNGDPIKSWKRQAATWAGKARKDQRMELAQSPSGRVRKGIQEGPTRGQLARSSNAALRETYFPDHGGGHEGAYLADRQQGATGGLRRLQTGPVRRGPDDGDPA